ncbi:nucleotide-binding alpha-beta plait domain-containing protein [Tanacetum coccineum]
MGSHRSKEDDVNRISISIYVTNFPENFSAKELFQSCKQYGHVVDSFIPRKRTKEGKRFGFVRFINVFNVDRLVNNLCTIWVGQFKLHANKARFQRATLNKGQGADHKKVANSSRPNSGDSGSSNSYVNAVKNHKSVDHDSPAIVLDEDCALSKDLSSSLMGRIKEFASLTNLKNALMNEGFVDLNVSYLGELWVLLEFSSVKSKEAFRDNVGVSSWFSEIRQASFDINPDGRIVWVEIEGVPLKLWTLNTFKRIVTSVLDFAKEVLCWDPDLVEDSDEEELSDDDSLEEGMKNLEYENDCSNSFEVPDTVFENEGGSKKDSSVDPFGLYPLLNKKTKDQKHKESGLAQKAKKDWAKELCVKNKVNFLAIQETKMEEIDLFSVRRCWGNSTFEHLHSNSDRFAKPSERRANIDMRFPKTISEDQSQDLSETFLTGDYKKAGLRLWPQTKSGPRRLLMLGDIVNEVQSAFIAEKTNADAIFLRGVSDGNISSLNLVIQAAAKLGCLVLKLSLLYLGTSVRRIYSVFHLSIFKVPSKYASYLGSLEVISLMAMIRGSKRASWVNWKHVLSDKTRRSSFSRKKTLFGLKLLWLFMAWMVKFIRNWTYTDAIIMLAFDLSEVRSLQEKATGVWSALPANSRGGIEQNSIRQLGRIGSFVTSGPSADDGIGIWRVRIKINVLAGKSSDALPTGSSTISRRLVLTFRIMSCPICDNALIDGPFVFRAVVWFGTLLIKV